MAEKLLIKNGVLFDGVDSEVKAGLTLEIENGIITYIGAERPAGGDVKVIDAVGKFIMPGIIDCHMHIGGMIGASAVDRVLEPNMQQAMVAVKQAEKTIRCGITTVCDVSMAGPYLKRLIDAGEIIGPRLLPCGQGFAMGGGGPYVDPEGLFSVDFLKANHPWGEPCDAGDTDRIYTDEEILAICDEAAMAGIPVLSHCESIEGTKAALRCGIKCILHGVELDEECIELFIEKGAWLMPTLNVNLNWADSDEDLMRRKDIFDFEGESLKEKECSRLLYVFKNAHERGVKIAIGSDTYCNEETPYGEFTMDEIKIFVKRAGIDVIETLRAATKYPAEALGISNKVGTLEQGKLADIVILKEDITKDIDLLTRANIDMVFKEGKQIAL